MTYLREMKVLYIEDDKETREALGKFLKRRVGKLYTAACGEEGVSLFEECEPDIIIADLLLPDITGIEMIKRIRQQDSACPVLITSTVNKVETILEAVDIGIVSYIVKPVDTAELEKKLEDMAAEVATRSRREERINYYDNEENKGIIEDEIRKRLLKIIKENSGKGPGKLTVYLQKNEIVVIAYDAMTLMERSLIGNIRNIGFVEQGRELFYRQQAEKIEGDVEEVTGLKFRLGAIEINAGKRTDKLTLVT